MSATNTSTQKRNEMNILRAQTERHRASEGRHTEINTVTQQGKVRVFGRQERQTRGGHSNEEGIKVVICCNKVDSDVNLLMSICHYMAHETKYDPEDYILLLCDRITCYSGVLKNYNYKWKPITINYCEPLGRQEYRYM